MPLEIAACPHTASAVACNLRCLTPVFGVYVLPCQGTSVLGRDETPMSKQEHATAKGRGKTEAPIVELGADSNAPMRGCDIVVKCLEREGVDTVFAYPGGASME